MSDNIFPSPSPQYSWQHGRPNINHRGDLTLLFSSLKESSTRAYEISSSYGLSGWVLARTCQRLARNDPAILA